MHYYSFHIGDYMRDTRHLSNDEDLAYRRLLDQYYLSEGPLKGDIKKLARLVLMNHNVEAVENILDEFFVQDGDKWVNNKCDEMIAKYHANSLKNKENGAKGGRPKGSKNKTQKEPNKNPMGSQSEASGNPEESQLKGNQEPITNNHKPVTNTKDKNILPIRDELTIQMDDIFNFWCATMKKGAGTKFTDDRKKAVKRTLKDGYTVNDIKQAITNCRNNPFNMGQNDSGTVYNDLELICRNDKKFRHYLGSVGVKQPVIKPSMQWQPQTNQDILNYMDQVKGNTQ